jgi:hypothetical protein
MQVLYRIMYGTKAIIDWPGFTMNCPSLRAVYRGTLCLALFAVMICIPVHAADPGLTAADSLLPIQEAYLAWMAEVSDAEMVAAISYVETLYGKDTRTMISLHDDFSKAKSVLGSITSMPALASHMSLMQKNAVSFNRETKNQTNAHQGKSRDLQEQIDKAVNTNPSITMKRDAYWAVRNTHQLDDFDTWVAQTQITLDSLQTRGYSTKDTQPYLDRFTSLKTDLKSSLDSKDFDRTDTTALLIRDRSREISDRIVSLQEPVSRDTIAEFRIDEADRIIARAERLNNQLVVQILDIGAAEPVLSRTKTDVKMARLALNGGQSGLLSTQLLLIKKDYRDLAAAYRDITVSASLQEGMADILKSTSISLEDTADRIGEP